jgi:hypothetical protein
MNRKFNFTATRMLWNFFYNFRYNGDAYPFEN